MSDIEKSFETVLDQIETSFLTKKVPKFKVLLKGASNNIYNLIDLLVRKSLLKEDLYNYNDLNSEKFFLPEEKNFMDADRPAVLYERLKAEANALEYIAYKIEESTEGITEDILEITRKVMDYFSFHNLSSTNSGVNTRGLRDIYDRILGGSDEIYKKICADTFKLLSDNYHSIQLFLEEMTKFNKEKYKYIIRSKLFPNLPSNLNEKLLRENNNQYLKLLENHIEKNAPTIYFNKYWIFEAIKECYSTNDIDVIERLKKNFLTEAEKKIAEHSINSPREKIIKLIVNLANAKKTLEELYINLEYNLKLIKSREKSVSEKFQNVFRKLFNIASDEDFFHIEYINPADKSIQKDTVNINDFFPTVKKKIMLFSEILKPTSSVYHKINSGTEDALNKFLDDTYFSTLLLKERIMGMDTEMKLQTPKKLRTKMRDMSVTADTLGIILSKVGEQRRKFIISQDSFLHKKK